MACPNKNKQEEPELYPEITDLAEFSGRFSRCLKGHSIGITSDQLAGITFSTKLSNIALFISSLATLPNWNHIEYEPRTLKKVLSGFFWWSENKIAIFLSFCKTFIILLLRIEAKNFT